MHENPKLPMYSEKYPVYNLSKYNSMYNIDIEYLNSLYPNEISELKRIVEQECDRLDYRGSMIYDECPDKVMVMKICNDICALANCKCKYAKKCEDKSHLRDIVNVLFTNEIYRRRHNRHNYF
jgi:hypothetical protein